MPRRHLALLSLVLLALGLTTVVVRAEVFRVTVTRVDKDLYRVEDRTPKLYIETQYCYEYATRDDAVLRYERYGSNNRLIFSSNTACDVKGIR